MTKPRLELQALLEDILGSRNVYFQPPESYKIKYPCIIYSLSNMDKIFADNKSYLNKKSYQLIIVDKNPDSQIPNKVSELEYCHFNSFYASEGLNHFVFTIYY
jgi:hypothetical protein